MTDQVETSTFIEFSRTLTDTKTDFSVTVSIKVGEEGATIGHEFGKSNGTSLSVSQGEITIEALRSLYEACQHNKSSGVEVEIITHAYGAEERVLSNQAEELPISFSEPLNFRPFLLKFLPIIIKTAELLDEHQLPSLNTSAVSAKC